MFKDQISNTQNEPLTHRLNIHEVPGDHKTFLFPPNDKEFAKIFENALKNK